MIRGVGHIGLAVADLERTLTRLCRALDLPRPAVRDVAEKKMKIALLDLGNVSLELLEDYSEEGAWARRVRERGNHIHHFCLLSDDIEADVKLLADRGVEMADQRPKTGLRGKRVAFISPSLLDGILFELSDP